MPTPHTPPSLSDMQLPGVSLGSCSGRGCHICLGALSCLLLCFICLLRQKLDSQLCFILPFPPFPSVFHKERGSKAIPTPLQPVCVPSLPLLCLSASSMAPEQRGGGGEERCPWQPGGMLCSLAIGR